MYKELNLKNEMGEDVKTPFLACASTPIRYKQVFGKEIMGEITSIMESLSTTDLNRIENASSQENVTLENMDKDTLGSYIKIVNSGKLNSISQLAYIMNLQALHADMMQASFEGYIDWMDNFESLEFLTNAMEIIEIYMAQTNGSSALKKNQGQQTEK